ncbi:MAG: RDD family protein [bacterium]
MPNEQKYPSNSEGVFLIDRKENYFTQATFLQRLLARLIDNLLYLVIFVLVLLLATFVLGKYIFPGDFNQYLKYSNQVSLYLSNSSKSGNDVFSAAQNCSFSDLSDSVTDLNQLCQNNKTYQVKIIYLTLWVMFVISNAYYIFFTASRLKATVGKIILQIKVVSDADTQITILQSVTREIFWILSGIAGLMAIYIRGVDTLQTLMFIFIISECTRVIFSNSHKNFHDTIAQTKVVRQ